MRRVVVASAHRLVELLGGDDDPGGASAAAEAGLRLDPANQLLWRDLLRARYATDGVAGVRRTLDAMGPALQGIPLEAETEALVAGVPPGGQLHRLRRSDRQAGGRVGAAARPALGILGAVPSGHANHPVEPKPSASTNRTARSAAPLCRCQRPESCTDRYDRNHRWSSSERSERSDETSRRTPSAQPRPPGCPTTRQRGSLASDCVGPGHRCSPRDRAHRADGRVDRRSRAVGGSRALRRVRDARRAPRRSPFVAAWAVGIAAVGGCGDAVGTEPSTASVRLLWRTARHWGDDRPDQRFPQPAPGPPGSGERRRDRCAGRGALRLVQRRAAHPGRRRRLRRPVPPRGDPRQRARAALVAALTDHPAPRVAAARASPRPGWCSRPTATSSTRSTASTTARPSPHTWSRGRPPRWPPGSTGCGS